MVIVHFIAHAVEIGVVLRRGGGGRVGNAVFDERSVVYDVTVGENVRIPLRLIQVDDDAAAVERHGLFSALSA